MATDLLEQMRLVFRAEALDLLVELDTALLTLEEDPGDTALVHRVFRAIHTIKGSGATAGFQHLARFAHKMEESFDLARDGRLAVSPALVDCGLKACDVIRLILEAKGESGAVAGEEEVTRAFERLLPGAAGTEAPKAAAVAGVESAARRAFSITCKPKREIFYTGADPVTVLDDLRELGQAYVTAHVEQVPPLAELAETSCYLWWDVILVTESDEAAVRDVFVFVEDDCEIQIRLREDQEADVALFGSVPEEALGLFVMECEEHLGEWETEALTLEREPASQDHLDALFRCVHSIKGNAGLLLGHVKDTRILAGHPLQQLAQVAHGLESLLEPYRGATAAALPEGAIQTSLDACDAIRVLLGKLLNAGAAPTALLARLGVTAGGEGDGEDEDWRETAFRSTTAQCMEMIAGCLETPGADGKAPVSMLETYMRGLRTLSSALRYRNRPELDDLLAKQMLILDAALRGGGELDGAARAELENAFQTTRTKLARGAPAAAVAEPEKKAGEAPGPAAPATIRIEQNKLDRLMRIVGELLVARGAFPPLVERVNEGADRGTVGKDLKEAGANISRIADELQSSVMSLRMLPVKTVFQRFPRLVRDLARSLGKDVRLAMEGEGIELDKTILEQIGDPLVHVIRNAVDHGLELPDVRRASGKEETGQLTLRARQEAGGVTLEVTDDGRGLDGEALKRKAISKGLLTADEAAVMSEEATYQLLFLPGLSTAEKVTDVSGRGVGMDVVRSNVRNLHGTIEIQSRPGRGTSFLIRLPASLMISKGILFEAGGEEYILPLQSIRDMVKLPASEAHEYQGVRLAQVRGTVYSIFSLAAMLGLPETKTEELSVAIVEAGAVKYGLAVDRFVNEVEVLVKPLTGGLEQCQEFQGAAILGDGRVVLVLNALECHRLELARCS